MLCHLLRLHLLGTAPKQSRSRRQAALLTPGASNELRIGSAVDAFPGLHSDYPCLTQAIGSAGLICALK